MNVIKHFIAWIVYLGDYAVWTLTHPKYSPSLQRLDRNTARIIVFNHERKRPSKPLWIY